MSPLSIVDALVLAGAAFWIWWVVARMSPPFLMFLLRPLRRRQAVRSFLACPWCAGAWITLAVVLAAAGVFWLIDVATWAELLVWTPFTWLASSAIVGVAGTLIPDDGEPLGDDDD